MATKDISQYLNSLERQDRYRVDQVLKTSDSEVTQLVYLPETNGAESGPYIRKIISRESGFGNVYERIYAEQQHNTFAHIPHIVDCVQSDDALMVVMEYIHGETLQDYIYRTDPSPDVARAIFPEICSAVQELHEAFDPPIIHRDLKPSNVMVANGSVFLIDFGIARDYKDAADTDTTHFGTRAYAPPEQFGYGQTSTKSDIYALGMLLYYCLIEQTPTPAVVNAHFADMDISQEMQNVLVRATEFDPKNRFASVRELKEAFIGATPAGTATQVPTPVPVSAPASGTAPTVIIEEPYQAQNSRDVRFYLGILWNIFVGLFCIGCCIYFFREAAAKPGDAVLGTYSLSSILILGLGLLVSDKRYLREKLPNSMGRLKNWHIFVALVIFVLFAATLFVFAQLFIEQ